ncbi:esterase family protein [Halobacillus fulvus]|nr:esterase family protein [Halobacillus fulvus]
MKRNKWRFKTLRSLLTDHQLDSKVLEKIFTYRILKADSQRERSVQMLLVHDGDDYTHLGDLKNIYEKDLQKGMGESTVFILLPPESSEERWHLYHSDGELQEAYSRFLYEELLPELHKRFDISRLGMLGDSLAGAVSLRIALQEPDIWSHLLLQSAAFSEEDVRQVRASSRPLPWTVYQTVGTQEDVFVSPITNDCLYILSRNRKVSSVLRAQVYDYQEFDHDHLWECWRKDLPNAIKIFYS